MPDDGAQGSSAKLNCSLQELIEQEQTPTAHEPLRRPRLDESKSASGRRIIRAEPGSEPRRGIIKKNRNLDLAVQSIVSKRTGTSAPPRPSRNRDDNHGSPAPAAPVLVINSEQGVMYAPPGIAILSAVGQQKRLNPSEAALLFTNVTQNEEGDVVVTFKQTELIKVKKATGDMILNSGGYRTFSTRAVLNTALQPVGLRIEEQHRDDTEGGANTQWVLSDGRYHLQSFEDGMVVKQVGGLTKQQLLARGSVILQFLKQKKANAEKQSKWKHLNRPNNNMRSRRAQSEMTDV